MTSIETKNEEITKETNKIETQEATNIQYNNNSNISQSTEHVDGTQEENRQIENNKTNNNNEKHSENNNKNDSDKKINEKDNNNNNNNTNNNNSNNNNYVKKPSSWNTGNAMEEFDFSEWYLTRCKELLLNLTFKKNSNIRIAHIRSIDGHADILYSRGRFRPGYELNFEVIWKGNVDDRRVEGYLNMSEISSDEQEDDWVYEVTSIIMDTSHKKSIKNS